MSTNQKQWKIEYCPPEVTPDLLSAGYNPLLSSILSLRGYRTAADAKLLIDGSSSVIHDPFLLKDMDKAVARIRDAVRKKERVAVYGDYDVDGITSTVLLTEYLRGIGLEVEPYIPDRSEEGYGLNCSALDSFRESGISLVITVDCGITAVQESAYAAQLGIDMIITDHHECKPDELPSAIAVIDSKQESDGYPFNGLAGVGVAFKLACACEGDSEQILDRFCDLVAIGTVADVMPLIDENRYFVRRGIEFLKANPRPGISAMLKDAGVDPAAITTSSIGFVLAPRINAAGRLGQAIMAADLLFCRDAREAAVLAQELCDLNRERQNIENEIWREATKLVEPKTLNAPLVIANDTWHQGVIGIAASRLADYFSIPTIMICLNGDVGKGSCRSYGGFNLFEALSACSEHLISFGGHALAAGLNIERQNIEAFREAISEYYLKNQPEPQPEVTCDLLICDASLLSEENVRSLDLLEPFGNANPKPVMCILDAKLESLQGVGSGKHSKLRITTGGKQFDCIYFSHSPSSLAISAGDFIDLAFTPQINEYRGIVSVQLVLNAVRRHNGEELSDDISKGCSYVGAARRYIPERADFVRVWKADSYYVNRCPSGMPVERYSICRRVFEEALLIDADGRKLDWDSKVDLNGTRLMKKLNES